MKISEIPKFVINLERRPDRLESITKEMKYMNWDFERFPAIDTNSYMGVTRSTLEIIKIAKEKKYPKIMIIEDDCIFMPYAKSLIDTIESSYANLEYRIFNLGPTHNREVNISKNYDLLLDLTNLPEAPEDARGIYGANMVIYDESVYDSMFEISNTAFASGDFYYALDDFTYKFILPKFQSYCPIIPIAPQNNGYSNISEGMYSNWYLQTYNWNRWCPKKIPNEFMDIGSVQKQKENNQHKEFYYVS